MTTRRRPCISNNSISAMVSTYSRYLLLVIVLKNVTSARAQFGTGVSLPSPPTLNDSRVPPPSPAFATNNDDDNDVVSFVSGLVTSLFDSPKSPSPPSPISPAVVTTVTKPTISPTMSFNPTVKPTKHITIEPTAKPTKHRTKEPTIQPTAKPTSQPSIRPTLRPTKRPTGGPTVTPTSGPTVSPTVASTNSPTVPPTSTPTTRPTIEIPKTSASSVDDDVKFDQVRPTPEPTASGLSSRANDHVVSRTTSPQPTNIFATDRNENPTSRGPPPTSSPTRQPTPAPTPLVTYTNERGIASITSNNNDQKLTNQPLWVAQLFSTSVELHWNPLPRDALVDHYNIYDSGTLIGTTNTTRIIVANLNPGSVHYFQAQAVDVFKVTLAITETLKVRTPYIVDDFADSNKVADDQWGVWETDKTGRFSRARIRIDKNGYTNSALRMEYRVGADKGDYVRLFLNFAKGDTVNLRRAPIIGLQFMVRGTAGNLFRVQIATSLSNHVLSYYSTSPIKANDNWERILLLFDEDFSADSDVLYSLDAALKSATGLVFINDNEGEAGYLEIDNVDFVTRDSMASLSNGVESEGTVNKYSLCLSLLVGVVALALL